MLVSTVVSLPQVGSILSSLHAIVHPLSATRVSVSSFYGHTQLAIRFPFEERFANVPEHHAKTKLAAFWDTPPGLHERRTTLQGLQCQHAAACRGHNYGLSMSSLKTNFGPPPGVVGHPCVC